MPSIAVTSLLVAAVLAQTVAPPVRYGPTAAHLSDDDFDQLRQLVKDRGRLWAVIGLPDAMVPSDNGVPWTVRVFLEPEANGVQARRGRGLTANAMLRGPGRYSEPRTWSIASTPFEWAQVKSANGNVAEGSTSNTERPFLVNGAISDEMLVSAVTFLRTSPPAPSKPGAAPMWQKVQGGWPILVLWLREPTIVEIQLASSDGGETMGESVVLVRAASGWTVKSLSLWAY